MRNFYFILICISCISLCFSCVNSNNLFSEAKSISNIYQLKDLKNEFVSIKNDEILHNKKRYKRFIYKGDNAVVFDGYFRLKNDTLFFISYHSVYQGCFDELFFFTFLNKDGYIGNSCPPRSPGICLIQNKYVYCMYMGSYKYKGVLFEKFRHQIMSGDHYTDSNIRTITGERVYLFNFNKGIFLESEIELSDGATEWYGY